MKNRILLAIMFLALFADSATAGFPRYHVTDMRSWTYGGSFVCLNNYGYMAGGTATRRLMVYDSTGIHQYAGSYPFNSFIAPTSMTDSGVVAGHAQGNYPFLWRKSTGFEPLPRYGATGGGLGSVDFSVTKFDESLNVASGYHEVKLNGAEDPHAVRWIKTNGTWTVEPSPTANRNVMWYGLDMNVSGQIVGYGNQGNNLVAQYWDLNGNGVQSLPGTTGWTAFGFGYDGQGRIFGNKWRTVNGVNENAMLVWNSVSEQPEEYAIGSHGFASESVVNRFGLVGGYFGISPGNYTAALWSREDGFARISDLVEPGTPFHNYWGVRQINDSGSMIVEAKVPGQLSWYRLRLDPVPEPTSLLLLIPGLAWVVMRRRKRHAGPKECRWLK